MDVQVDIWRRKENNWVTVWVRYYLKWSYNSADTIDFPKIFSFDSIFHALSDATGIKSIRVKSSVLMRAEFRYCRFSVFCVFLEKLGFNA